MKKIIHNILYNIIFPNHKLAKVKVRSITSKQFPYDIGVIADKLYVP